MCEFRVAKIPSRGTVLKRNFQHSKLQSYTVFGCSFNDETCFWIYLEE